MADLVADSAERFALTHTTPFDGTIADAAAWTQANTPSPGMMSGLAEARLLEGLIVAQDARLVLEIGTFTAVGALAMAAALSPGGRVVTLEADEETAAVARRHIDASPYSDRVELILGDALARIPELDGPFDLVYIDAWKRDYPRYYDAVVEKLSPRGVIVADNMFRAGAVLDPNDHDDGTIAMREFVRRVQADERVHNVLLTVGDGLMLAWRVPDGR